MRHTEVAGRVRVTTLTDTRRVSPLDLDVLDRQRWHVEGDLRAIKAVMGLEILRATSPRRINKERAVYLLAYNLVRALMARTAAGGGHDHTSPELQGNAATALGVSTPSALGCGEACRHHTCAPA